MMEIKTVSLKDYSSLRVGGEGRLVEVKNIGELKEAVLHAKAEGLRVQILGEGTNSYFGEDLSEFLFMKLELTGIQFLEKGNEVFATAQAGESWDNLVNQSVNKKLWGIENLSHIPGTVGAAPVQNIGAYGVELAEVVVSLQALDMETLKIVELSREACDFGYRDSIFKYPTSPDGFAGRDEKKYIILSVTLKLYKDPHPVLLYKPLDMLQGTKDITPEIVRNAVIETRKAKLPDWKEFSNAGSFFKNPIVDFEVSEYVKNLYPDMPLNEVVDGYKIPAAWLVDHVANMKGMRVGGVGTWLAQPLVIVNYGNATANDIDEFAKDIRTKVNEKTGIVLEQEVNRVG